MRPPIISNGRIRGSGINQSVRVARRPATRKKNRGDSRALGGTHSGPAAARVDSKPKERGDVLGPSQTYSSYSKETS